MIRLDKTFPTLDCSSCILTPKMTDVAMHEGIELLVSSFVRGVRREGARFCVQITKRARFVREELCIACGACREACAMKNAYDEFNENLSRRPAIYIPFPQAVPQRYLVDRDSCLYLAKGRCKRRCAEVCPTSAIDFAMEDRTFEEYFDSIVLCTGFDLFDPREKVEFGYGKYEGVLTSVELERLLSATGPTGGEIVIGGRHPRRFLFIQCVGSRDRAVEAPFCSRICCMYTAKQARLIKERVKDSEVYVCYIDVRAYGKGYEEFYRAAQEEGVVYIRGIPGEIREEGDHLIVRVEDTLIGRVEEMEVDSVVLALGVRPKREARRLFEMLDIRVDPYGFVKTDPGSPSRTSERGIFVCGMASSPKDIAESVSSAVEASASVMEHVGI
jgi:heterodisulfide reductase subunit A